VAGAVSYNVQIGLDPEFRTVVERGTAQGTYYVWRTRSTQAHFWRVQSLDAEGRPGRWSDGKRIGAVIGVPQLEQPGDGARLPLTEAGPRVTLRFTPVPNARSYQVEVFRSDGGDRRKRDSATTQTTVELGGPGSYRWRARAILPGVGEAPWSQLGTFQLVLPGPRLAGPADNDDVVAGQPVRLRVSPVPAASSIVVEVSDDPRFRRNLAEGPISGGAAKGGSFTYKPLAPGVLRWRARSVDASGTPGEPTAPRRLRVVPPSPELLEPAAGAVVRAPARGTWPRVVFRWRPVPGAASYRLVLRPSTGAERVVETAHIPQEVGDLPSGAVRWTVVALPPGGRLASRPAPERELVITSTPLLAAPRLQAPADGETVSPTFVARYAPVGGASAYEVELSRRVDFGGTNARTRQVETRAQLGPLERGPAYVRVRAVAADNVPGEWSVPRRVEVQAAGVAVAPVRGEMGLSAGPRVGFQHNLGEVAAAHVGVDLRWRLPVRALDRRLGLRGEVGFFTASMTVPGAGLPGDIHASIYVIPVLVGLDFEILRRFVSVYVGAGFYLGIVRQQQSAAFQPQTSDGATAPGFYVSAGTEKRLGPGLLFAEGRYARAPVETPALRLETGGFVLDVGYRLVIR
jgi:hypothetical protein